MGHTMGRSSLSLPVRLTSPTGRGEQLVEHGGGWANQAIGRHIRGWVGLGSTVQRRRPLPQQEKVSQLPSFWPPHLTITLSAHGNPFLACLQLSAELDADRESPGRLRQHFR